MFWTYILKSEKTDNYYIGQTEDIDKRTESHNNSRVRSTKFGVPWKLVYKKEFIARTDAMKHEKYLKSFKKRKYLENLIANFIAG